jgi:hypothetical protein
MFRQFRWHLTDPRNVQVYQGGNTCGPCMVAYDGVRIFLTGTYFALNMYNLDLWCSLSEWDCLQAWRFRCLVLDHSSREMSEP